MTFDLEDLPDYCHEFMVKGRNGYNFNQAIKDSVIFEYHDILNDNPLPDLDIILVRDVLSFFPVQEQNRLINSFKEKLKDKGIAIVGRNEILSGLDWEYIGKEPVSAFMHTE